MRSTRATAAVARLNARSEGRQYRMVLTGTGQFILRERNDADDSQLSDELSLDDFVRLVDGMGPKRVARLTKSEAAFLKQLVTKDAAP